ncbi:MAG TPA: DUF4386 domain-containing protein [Gaiellaceae bacterium]|nr:DUF4386 domain-containing protein [Gaiellaceae bacterium]
MSVVETSAAHPAVTTEAARLASAAGRATPYRSTARWAGIWFILTFAASIPAALWLYTPVLDHEDYILGGGADSRIALGALLEVVTVIANIATAVVLFPVVRRVKEGVALGYVASRIVESTAIVVGLISLMSVVTLRQDLAGKADAGTLTVAGHTLVAVHDWTFLLGPAFCAGLGNGLLLGYLMYTSRLVPRRMAMVGLAGGALALVTATAVLFGAWNQESGVSFLLTAGEIVWEAFLGIYLTFRGFRPEGVAALGKR